MSSEIQDLRAVNIAAIMPPAELDFGAMLRAVKKTNRWSTHDLAAVLGVSPITLHTWLGYRKFAGAGRSGVAAMRRLIWLIDAITHHPDRLSSWKSIATWGREGLPPDPAEITPTSESALAERPGENEGGEERGGAGVGAPKGYIPVRDSSLIYRTYPEWTRGFVLLCESGECGGMGEGI